MRFLTVSEFVDLLKSASVSSFFDVSETVSSSSDCESDYVWGWIWNELVVDGFKVIYQNTYEHPVGKPSLLELSSDVPDLFLIENRDIVVIDDDGDVLDVSDILDIIVDHTGIDLFDLSILGFDQTIDIDMDVGDMVNIVRRDNDLDIRFVGEEIASVSSSPDNAFSDYSGSVGRWTELSLYRTVSGRYICESIDYTQWQGEITRYGGCVCDSIDQVLDFFGHGRLAKELYENAGIDAFLDVD